MLQKLYDFEGYLTEFHIILDVRKLESLGYFVKWFIDILSYLPRK